MVWVGMGWGRARRRVVAVDAWRWGSRTVGGSGGTRSQAKLVRS